MPGAHDNQADWSRFDRDQSAWRRFRDIAFGFVSMIWLGGLLGVSFLATPVKFQAPSLDLPTALDVGRVTFALLSKTEWTLCALLIASTLVSPQSRNLRLGFLGVLVVVLLLQAVWLLPVLDARVSQIMTGVAVPGTAHHLLYIAAEALKVLVLLGLSIDALSALRAPQGFQRCG